MQEEDASEVRNAKLNLNKKFTFDKFNDCCINGFFLLPSKNDSDSFYLKNLMNGSEILQDLDKILHRDFVNDFKKKSQYWCAVLKVPFCQIVFDGTNAEISDYAKKIMAFKCSLEILISYYVHDGIDNPILRLKDNIDDVPVENVIKLDALIKI